MENIEDIEIGTSSGETPGAAAAAGSRHANEDMSTKPNAKEPHEEPNTGGEVDKESEELSKPMQAALTGSSSGVTLKNRKHRLTQWDTGIGSSSVREMDIYQLN